MDESRQPVDSAFDLRAGAELRLAFDPGEPPAHLLRHAGWWSRRGSRLAVGLALLSGATAIGLGVLRPPEVVREAIDHEYYERTLRGSFMDPATLRSKIGLQAEGAVPGYPQLMRPCDIGGRLVYHLTTFFEHGGMVSVFALDRPVPLDDGSGWWNNVHWQVVRGKDGQPLILVSQQKRALAVARATLAKPPAS